MKTYQVFWDIFENTGNLEAYLLYKSELRGTKKSDNNKSTRGDNKGSTDWRI